MDTEFTFNLVVFFGSFLPTYIAVMRGHPQEKAIFALNAFAVVLAGC